MAAQVTQGPDTWETVFYRTRDPVRNFHVRATLRKVTAASSSTVETGEEAQLMREQRTHVAAVPEEEEIRVVRWQEKVFSRREMARYRDPEQCTTPIEQEYAAQVQRLEEQRQVAESNLGREGTLLRGRLFTYVDSDEFFDASEATRTVTTAPTGKPSFLAERMHEVRRRHGYRSARHATAVGPSSDHSNPVTTKPTERQLAARVIDTPFQTQHIMADLHEDGDDVGRQLGFDDIVLCTIKMDAHGVLEMRPDFNGSRPPYRIETSGGVVFEFSLEHASVPITPAEQDKELGLYRELYSRHAELLANRVGSDFDHGQPGATTLHVFGEVVSAERFEYDDLYVHLLADFPEGWRVDKHSTTEDIVSQICRSTSVGDADAVARFALPFEMCCSAKDEVAAPTIFLQINSLDGWERHRVEGYGYVSVPSDSGSYELELQTWKPAGNDIYGKMRRFFVGGAPELEDMRYVAVPPEHDIKRKLLNKAGLRTESSGSVTLRLNVVKQRATSAGAAAEQKAKAARRVFASTQAFHSANAVLAAFQQAKQRMARVDKPAAAAAAGSRGARRRGSPNTSSTSQV